MEKIAIIVFAAGKGKRMKSSKAKVLHEIHGKPMIYFVLDIASLISNNCIVVVGHQAERVKEIVKISLKQVDAINDLVVQLNMVEYSGDIEYLTKLKGNLLRDINKTIKRYGIELEELLEDE